MNESHESQTPSVEALLGGADAGSADSASAFNRYVAKHGYPERPVPSGRSAFVGVGAVLLLIVLFSFAPARSLGQRILSMLRVQKVAVVPFDMEAVSAAANSRTRPLAQVISDRVVVTIKPGEPQVETSPAAAASAAGFQVKNLDTLGDPNRIVVRDESAFHLQLDRDRILALFEAAGRPDVTVPADVDGAIVAVHIPKGVEMSYGQCSGSNAPGCIHFTQIPVPAISIPPSLNMAGLAEAALQIGGMSAAEANAFCQTVDWSSTLVIPIPRNASSSRTVPVDGVNGTLVETNGRRGADYALIWVKNRQLFALSGLGSPDQALAAAESLH